MKKVFPSLFIAFFILLLPLHTYAATLDEVKTIIENDYVGEINGNLETATSISEMMEMLDPHSTYFTKEEYESFVNSIDNTTVGIGVVIEKHEKGILILDVVKNGSASKGGEVEVGDIITEVNGQPTKDLTIEHASSLITGAEGTIVSLTLLKKDGTTKNVTIPRKPFSVENVSTKLLYGNVGYIQLNSYSSNGVSEVKEAYQSLVSKGATSFILDLQNNGGGYVSTAEDIIGLFPGAKNAYKLRISEGIYTAPASYQAIQFPENTRVLVNRFSASASEMTAAALLDQNAGILYGEQTYGKGSMQSFYQLSDGSYLKLTVGEFYGPNDTVVNNIGVKPHKLTESNPVYLAHYDSIVEHLQGYAKLNDLLNVPTTKKFTINFTKPVQLPNDPNAIELVKLGGDPVEITPTLSEDGKHIVVTPKNPLQPGSQYILLIHPTIQDTDGRNLKSGYYLKTTVQSNNGN
ncbi:S41 family peptidase [Ureibacillus acetophenoni]|uniref:Carboxyl-terminal processing protease n=1 Tax=Ureibacillus acetophenoni TaxID=614649 RepID=A0A285TZ96_9BACL|nr:S41 family peptidase [Ureibacillus acetophenoni]SOC34892.1 carboxyl-terminal processing protease [Ureibacillus acetophenoni]